MLSTPPYGDDDNRNKTNPAAIRRRRRRLDWTRRGASHYFAGRRQECELLQNSFITRRMIHSGSEQQQRCRIFFIQGESGSGKSALVEHAFRDDHHHNYHHHHHHHQNSSSPARPARTATSPPPPPPLLVVAKAKFDAQGMVPLQAWVDAIESILTALEHDNDFRIHLYTSFQLSSEQSADYLSILTSVVGNRLKAMFEDRPKHYRGMIGSKRISQQSFMSLAVPPPPNLDEASSSSMSLNNTNSSSAGGGGGGFSTAADKDYSFGRLRVAYRELYRVISQYIPIVLFMDDIQWGEPDDFKIMETIIDDHELEDRLIFVAAHRPVGMLHGLNLLKQPGKRTIQTITMSPLKPFEMTELLHKLLGRDESDLLELTRVLDQKTGGNPFFVRQFLQALEDHGFLQYSTDNGRWEWDLERILQKNSETSAINDNALESVSQKMLTGGHPQLGTVLSRAAFLGSTRIHVTALLWILEEETNNNKAVVQSEQQLQTILQEAVEMNLIDRGVGTREYRFAHDQIRQAALTLLLPPDEHLAKRHMRLGLRLRSLWEKNPTEDRLLFQATAHLNHGKPLIKTAKERFKLAQLNVRAAEVAMKRSAFYPAIHFLRRTKDLLGEGDYDFDIFDFEQQTETALARMEYCCGLLDRSITRADAIIKVARDDRVKAEGMHLKAICFTQQKKPLECLEVAIDALSSFDVHYPRKFVKISVLRLYSKTKKLLKNFSDEDLLSLRQGKVLRYQLAAECLPWIGEMALVTYGYNDHYACCMLTAMVLSLEKGRNSMTAQTLATWGLILAEEGMIAEAYRFGRLAKTMAEDRIGGVLDDRVPSLYYKWHHHLRHPYVEGVEPFSNALKNLWARGALEAVVMDTSGYLRLQYLAGVKLQALLKDMRQFRDLCNDFGMTMARSLIDPFGQMVLNLVEGPSEDMLRGDFMMETKSIKFWKQNRSKIGIQLYYFHKMVVAYYFNSYNLAAKLATKVTSMYPEGADNLVPYRFFFRALAAWTGYGITKRYKFRKLAGKMTAQVTKLVDAGLVNCNHSLLFLRAEQAAALCSNGRNREAVKKAFDVAISAAGTGGFLYDQALAIERAGQYFVKIDDKSCASTYLQRAQGCYLDWEANAKAAQMVREYGLELLGEANQARISQATSSSFASSRARLSDSIGLEKLMTVESDDDESDGE